MAVKWPWSHHGQSTVESGGDALKDGTRDRHPSISVEFVPVFSTFDENESQPIAGRDSFSTNCWRKAFKQCTVSADVEKFQRLLKYSGLSSVTLF